MTHEIGVELTKAIFLRDKVQGGLEDQAWVRAQIARVLVEGFWNASQVAGFVGYSRQGVSSLARGLQLPRPALGGGTVPAGSLELIVELRRQRLAGEPHRPAAILAAVRAGVSTRLLATLTGIPIGVILYQQRKDKK